LSIKKPFKTSKTSNPQRAFVAFLATLSPYKKQDFQHAFGAFLRQ
jgi:hypothetical protein